MTSVEGRPSARFTRFERVEVVEDRPGGVAAGRLGTVVWCDGPCFNRRTGAWGEWAYVVAFADPERYRAFRESNLRATGRFDPEGAFLGRGFEFAFDTVIGDDEATVEGCYRLPGAFWQVFTFLKTDVSVLGHRFVTWPSGITGVEFNVPWGERIDRAYLVRSLEGVFGPGPWSEVDAPNSLMLK